MGTYVISFDRIGRKRDIPTLTASGDDDEVMDQIYRYARPHLGSRDVEVTVNFGERRGYVFVGQVRSAGEFTLQEVPATCEGGCWHLMSLHGPGGCTAKVFPAHSLEGEPCPCEAVPGEPARECAYCGEHVTFLGGSWTTDDGTTACYASPGTSAPYVPHKPKEN